MDPRPDGRAGVSPTLLPACPSLALAASGKTTAEDARARPPLMRAATGGVSAHADRVPTGVAVARVQRDLGFRVAGKAVERWVDRALGQPARDGAAWFRIHKTSAADGSLAGGNADAPVPTTKGKIMRSPAAETRLARAVSILVLASAAACAARAQAAPPVRPLSPVERRADQELWRRSGAAALQAAASYDTTMAERYDAAYQQYLRWRSGPEFEQEVRKLREAGR